LLTVRVLDYAEETAPPANALLSLKSVLFQGEDLLQSLPVGLYTCDRDGILVQYNRRAAEIWGQSPPIGNPAIRYCGAHKAFHAGTGDALAESPMCAVLRTGEPMRARELVFERPDGSRATILANIEPLFDGDDIIGGVNCFQDITDYSRTRGELRDHERSFRDLLEALPAAIYTTDAKGKVTFFNKAAAALAGRTPKIGEDEWCVTWRLYNADGTPLPHDQCPMAQALKRNEPIRGVEAVVERPDGTRFPMIPYPTPLRDSHGNLVGAVNMLIDITERKRAETRQKALIDEVNHRVKNTLATVQALAGQTLRGAVSSEIRDTFEARLLALSRVHDQLARRRWEYAEVETILKDAFAPYRGERGDRIRLGGSSVRLPPKVALTLAMVLHELATNAAQYGALSAANGVLTVTWHQNDARTLRLEWDENGGPPVRKPEAEGFGLKLLMRGIQTELDGETQIEFAPHGVHCVIDIPLRDAR
jgi:PAS domain S-box-containing protein